MTDVRATLISGDQDARTGFTGSPPIAASLGAHLLDSRSGRPRWLSAFTLAIEQRRFDDADALLTRMKAMTPQIFPPSRLLLLEMRLRAAQRRPDDVRQLIAQLTPLAERNMAAARGLAAFLFETGHDLKAMEWLERAHTREPENVATLLAIVNVYQKLGRRELAYQFVDRALKQGRPTAALMRLASMYQDDGRADEAAAHLREVLVKHPNHPNALASLLISRTADHDEAVIATASAVIKDEAQIRAPRAAVAYALASSLDRSGRYDEAFAQADTANRLVREDHPHDLERQRQRYHRVMNDLMLLNDSRVVARKRGDVTPIFVIGMPRSGTTLLDFVLGGHPDCTGMGELSFIPSAIASFGFGRSHFRLPTEAVLDELVQRFREMLRLRRIGTRYIVDKMPENYRYLPLIKALFPEAPVIHAIRHPLDNLISIFFQNFSHHQTYSTSIEGIAEKRRWHDHCADTWAQLYPNSVTQLDYEAFVAAGSDAIEPLVRSCGLRWDPTTLNYLDEVRTIRTPSRHAVRRPINTTAVARWRNYERHLLPVMDLAKPR